MLTTWYFIRGCIGALLFPVIWVYKMHKGSKQLKR